MPVPLRANANLRAEAKYNVVTECTSSSLSFSSLFTNCLSVSNYGLHSAAASGNRGLVEYALTRGQPVNSVLDGVLPLHAACAGGDDQVVKLLIDHGADVNAPRSVIRNVLHPNIFVHCVVIPSDCHAAIQTTRIEMLPYPSSAPLVQLHCISPLPTAIKMSSQLSYFEARIPIDGTSMASRPPCWQNSMDGWSVRRLSITGSRPRTGICGSERLLSVITRIRQRTTRKNAADLRGKEFK
jgi:hypothetical protein